MISFFVTATDTDVGKTFVCKHIAKAFGNLKKKVGYFKPLQSGVIEGEPTDAKLVENHCKNIVTKNSYVTKTPAAPSLSAEIAGVQIDIKKIKNDYEDFKKNLDVVIVEGSGGLFVPVDNKNLMSDLILLLDIPTIVIARPDLGTVNHTLMTLSCLEALGVKIIGVVISNYPNKTQDPSILNAKKMIETHSKHKVLAQIPHNPCVDDFLELTLHLAEVARQQP